MIDYTVFRESFEQYIYDNFTSLEIQFENTFIKGHVPYINIIDQNTSGEVMGAGETISDVRGLLVVQIFTVLGSGTVKARQAATELSSLLSGFGDDDISFSTPVLASFGPVDGAEYYQHNLTIPYQYFYGQG